MTQLPSSSSAAALAAPASSPRWRSLGVALALVTLAACKGETTYKDTPDTLAKVTSLQASITEKDKLIKDYELRISTLERDGAGGGSGELLITFEGDVLKVSPAKAGARPQIDDAAAAALSQKFIDVVQKSRGAIQKCYEQALKKNSSLQARSVTLKISASFAASGEFQKTSFNGLGDPFDACLRAVAAKWKLPAGTAPVTFQAPVSLTPS
ncbi:MAG: hypothetical protein R2939_21810 [Kofleriaceae bacterium]